MRIGIANVRVDSQRHLKHEQLSGLAGRAANGSLSGIGGATTQAGGHAPSTWVVGDSRGPGRRAIDSAGDGLLDSVIYY